MFIPNKLEIVVDREIEHVEYDAPNIDKINPCIQHIYNKMLMSMLQDDFVSTTLHQTCFDILIDNILKLTFSKYACICICEADENKDYVMNKLSNSYKGIKYRKFHKKHFKHLASNELIHKSVDEGVCIISNDFPNDPRISSNERNVIKRVLTIPLFQNGNCIAQILLVNKKKPYSVKNITKIYQLMFLITKLIKTYDNYVCKPTAEVDDLKHNFLATMSHEVRTPLYGIVGMISLIQEAGALNEQQREYLKRALNCCEQLTEIISDILDYSKMKSGHLELNEELFELKDCIEDAFNVVESKAKNKNLSINVNYGNSVKHKIYGDAKRLRQILINILNNAVKFTNEGGITLNIGSKYDKETGTNQIRFSVTDTGIGIAKEDQKTIFKMFEQVQTEYYDQQSSRQGTGMGLAICKELLGLMNSDLFVSSEGAGYGSTFYFTIDFQTEIDINELKKISGDIGQVTILVVDNEVNNRMILSSYLHNWDMNYKTCSSATEALHELRLGNHFDLAIIDVCMPQISGIELAQKIRQEFTSLPIIALSSKEVASKGKIWFDVFMNKPYNKVTLYRHIVELVTLEKSGMLVERQSRRKSKTLDTLKICVAEDDINHQFMIMEMLKSIGVNPSHICITPNGEVACQEIKHKHYDLCFMDLKMPVMDGFKASKVIKQYPNSPSIVALSASILDVDKQKCSKIGMDGYLTKPIVKRDLENVIKRYVN